MANEFSKEKLTELINDTRKQVKELLKSEDLATAPGATPGGPSPSKTYSSEANGKINKDEGDDSAPPKKDGPPADASSDSASASSSDSSGSDASGSAIPDGPPAPDASAAPADPAAASAAPADAAAAAGSAGGDPVATLVNAYSQLDDGALKAHFLALKQVIASKMAAAQASAAAPAAPGAPAPIAAPPGAGAAPAPGEASPPVAPGADMALKSEKEILSRLEKSEKANEELQKSLDTVSKAFELLMRKPERKAIRAKDVAALAKNEVEVVNVTKLNKSELSKKLSDLAKSPDLQKSERNLINDYFNNKVKVEKLQVLFDPKK